jgi:hypothetical protein
VNWRTTWLPYKLKKKLGESAAGHLVKAGRHAMPHEDVVQLAQDLLESIIAARA